MHRCRPTTPTPARTLTRHHSRRHTGFSRRQALSALAGVALPALPLSNQAAADGPPANAMTPWNQAIERHDLPALLALIQSSPNLLVQDSFGWTPLHMAAMRDFGPGVSALLAAGARLDARNRRGDTPLHHAGPLAQPLLLAAGADARVRNAQGQLPLHTCDRPTAALLVPGVNARDALGMTALHAAAVAGNADKIAWLLAQGADPALRSTGPWEVAGDPGWREPDVVQRLPPGQRALDLVQWQHDRVKWATGRYSRALDLLDAATPRAGWFTR